MVMLVPLLILAVLSVVAGFKPVSGMLSAMDPRHGHHEGGTIVLAASILTLVAGVALGFLLYRRRESDPLASNALFKVFRNKFYIDEAYAKIVHYAQDVVAAIAHFFDEFLINGLLVGGLSRGTASIGNLFRRLQSGNLQGYAVLFAVGILLVIYLTVFIDR